MVNESLAAGSSRPFALRMPRRTSAKQNFAAYTAIDLRKSVSGNWGTTIMSRTLAVVFSTVVAAISMTGAASDGCYNCYTPPPCTTCYQQQYVQPQHRTVDETVMVSPGSVVAHRANGKSPTVMVS